ncbi:Thiamine repressible regulatory thi1 [Hyphodiscus hymeniophilus]|uniref:Thiamine repressible regulatory thi1 n=1 Tax=Hyphodiscus hymeniophilus TaxID=353542 RepID=A0A9P7AY37_9HELO|nr:Thiamine repressible regulatory thi1 [Hyphodiscus hymeniophilus]
MSTTPRSQIDKAKNACVECKRRKIRCNGQQPCSACHWYKHPERCLYKAPQARLRLSRRSLDAVRQRLDESLDVHKRLFPLSTLDDLIPLSREKLLDLLNSPQNHQAAGSITNNDPSPSSLTYSTSEIYESPQKEHLEAVTYAEPVNIVGNRVVADEDNEVHALSLRLERPSSHLSASSAMAGLRVLLSIAPESLFMSQRGMRRPGVSTVGPSSEPNDSKRGLIPSVSRDTQSLVEAYFARIHPLTPIFDEKVFRATVAANSRTDAPWLGLLNMVYALGAIACYPCDSVEDIYYYNKAKTYIGIESFGSGQMETLQAFTLISGYYLHYRNRPNMASAIMGAIFRMAYALDLHKELPGPETSQDRQQRELRRRIWWTLVVLDTAEATTLGRVPLMDAFSFKVNVPKNIDDSTGEVTNNPTIYSKLIADIDFSKEVIRIQERLISSQQQLEFTETLTLDAQLVYWFQNLPPYMKSPEPCPEWLVQPRAGSNWKYLSLRIILHRPVLLEAALRRLSLDDLTADQRICLSKCQSLARTCIDNIGAEWRQNQYSGWPGGWFLLQACVIPLLSLYTFGEETEQAVGWNQQVQKAIHIFEEMIPWGIAARRTYELISALYSKYRERPNSSAADNTIVLQQGSSAIDDQSFDQQQPQQILGNLDEWPLWEEFSTYPDLDLLDIGADWKGWDFAMETEGWNQN